MNKKLALLLLTVGLLFTAACSSNNAAPDAQDGGDTANPAAGIELTSQIEGVFRGFDGENAVKIEHDGKVETYEIVDEVTGDLDTVKEGDNIAFSTKEVDGKTVLETLRLN